MKRVVSEDEISDFLSGLPGELKIELSLEQKENFDSIVLDDISRGAIFNFLKLTFVRDISKILLTELKKNTV